jgi:hypothetical protein
MTAPTPDGGSCRAFATMLISCEVLKSRDRRKDEVTERREDDEKVSDFENGVEGVKVAD